jgi:aspartyl protease family protein
MLKNALLFAGAGLMTVFMAPFLLPALNGDAPSPPPRAVAPVAQPAAIAPPASVSSGFRELSLAADSNGGYFVDGFIDGVSVRFIVDTGASLVSITPETASRLGLVQTPSSPQYRLTTANGQVTSYGVKLPGIDLGSIYVKDIDAVVNPNMSGVNLLGANFLQRLAGVEQRDGRLILRQ